MTSEIEEAVARLGELPAAWDLEDIYKGTQLARMDALGEDVRIILSALTASQAEAERLKQLARDRGVTGLKLTEDGGAHLCRAEAAEARATRAEALVEEATEMLRPLARCPDSSRAGVAHRRRAI